MSGDGGPKRVGDLLEGVLEASGVRRQVRRTGVMDEWSERVGERIARVAEPRSVSESVLFVEVRSSAWLMELNTMKKDILRCLNEGREDAPLEKLVFVLAEDG